MSLQSPTPSSKKPLVIAAIVATHIVGIFVGVAAAPLSQMSYGQNAIAGYFTVTPVVAVLLMGYCAHYVLGRVSTIERTLTASFGELATSLPSTVKKYLTPSFFILGSEREVARAAADMTESCISAGTPMHYIGAANFQSEPGTSFAKDALDARKQMKNVWSRAMVCKLQVTRWICLLSAENYASRSPEAQQNYVIWITRQVEFCEANPQYRIFHCPKAPTWESADCVLTTDTQMLTMIGNGIGGKRINGEEVVKPLLESWMRLFNSSHTPPELYDAARLRQHLEEDLSLPPRIRHFEDADQLRDAAADLLETALSTEDVPDALVDSIVYLGSAGLIQHRSNRDQTRYDKVVRRLMHKNAKVRRYIQLLDVDGYQERAKKTREQYERWLETQIELLSQNKNYEFYDCPRAQPWGSSNNVIMTSQGSLEIVGSAEYGREITGSQPSDIGQFFAGKKVKPDRFSANRLQQYLDTLAAQN